MPRKDPRISSTPDTVNERMLDRMIRHLLFLTGLQTHEANWMDGQLTSNLFPQINSRVASALSELDRYSTGSSVLSIGQQNVLSVLRGDLTSITTSFMNTTQARFFSRLQEIARNELDFEMRLAQKTVPVELNFKRPSLDQIDVWLRTQPLDGKPLSDWFTGMSSGTVDRINQQIRIGLVNGETIDEIARRIRGTKTARYKDGVLATTSHHAEAIARSGVIFANDQVSRAFYRENDDIIKKIAWVLTLDSRTCLRCAKREAESPYDVDKAPPTPEHVRCRCVTSPVFKSWRELGFDIDEIPEGTRASMSGQVPASMTYNEWLRKQPRYIVEQALGKTKAELFMKGDLDVSAFTDRQGNILNLEELKRKESDIFEELGINLN